MSTLSTHQLSIDIGGKSVCSQLDLELTPGQIWGVLGRNGVGKTTLIHTLAGLRDASDGQILLENNDLHSLSRKQIAQKIGLLLQHVEDPFPATVLETVVSGRHPHISNWQWESRDDYQLAQQALTQVDMAEMAQRQVNHLSGGERQRVALATLLTQNPEIFLLDEPNSHLDLHHQSTLLSWICNYTQQQQRVLLMSLHDINLAAKYCTHILLLLGNGEYLAGTQQDMLTEEQLQKAFGHPVHHHKIGQINLYIPD